MAQDLVFVHNFKGQMEACKNVIIFGFDNSSSVYIDGRNKNILVLGEGPRQGLDNATITGEAKCLITF